ncbi:hypothetical protein CROQUDRAFT_51891 [Cronartium quercuum f. sp. fusiforme G11]|uniref:Uncharacterized protein n=1 Tax=Cronartium quercuum f. sp. fusiforme G11 TaxID=708437 RepID=A0A9P6NCN8_9BASI|nr:hypothetical protein CROQUDRAFT_51891 [Cronartium quercuum f. sp. fusiforme G11]
MFASIEFWASYLSQSGSRKPKLRASSPPNPPSFGFYGQSSPPPRTHTHNSPPPYEEIIPPPSYESLDRGGLSLVDRNNGAFKIYYSDLVNLVKEWSRRRGIKADPLRFIEGGPFHSPRRIADMRELFMSIVKHQSCHLSVEMTSCDCRSIRWALLKQEWCEVLLLMGIIAL